jgi:hypothetical protein
MYSTLPAPEWYDVTAKYKVRSFKYKRIGYDIKLKLKDSRFRIFINIKHGSEVSAPRWARTQGPWDFPDSPLSRAARQPLLLGVFLNLQDIHISSHPTENTWTFDHNVQIVRQAEAPGFELAFSRTQWLPKGGYDGEASLDAFVALGAMAAVTKNILLSRRCMCSTDHCTHFISPNMEQHWIISPKAVGESTS